MSVYKSSGTIKSVLLAGVAAMSLVPTGAAAEITLKSADGSTDITGELIDYSSDFYTIRTPLGELRISAERVRCEGAECPRIEVSGADIKIAGAETVGVGLMPLLMQGYGSFLDAEASVVTTENAGESLARFIGDGGFGDELDSFLVTSTSSDDAFRALTDGTATIGMSSRRIRPDEARQLRAGGAGNMVSPEQEHIVAVDALVLITNPSNPVSELTIDQVRDIYTGRLTNWKQLGGPDLPIMLVSRQENSGTREVFEERIFGDREANIAKNAVNAAESRLVSSIVKKSPGAIGYVGFAFQRGAKPVSIVNECGISTYPTRFSAKTEEYPLQRRMYLYNRSDNLTPAEASFLDFAGSEAADGVIRKSGFIDLGISTEAMTDDSPRGIAMSKAKLDDYEAGFARDMMQEMVDNTRLSTTFRFKTGSTKLDERGLLDMKRLVSYLADLPQGTDVTLVGFTDNVGAFDSNYDLGLSRASEVAKQVRAFAPEIVDHVNLKYSGYGEVAPVACNATDLGRAINRRVEVWVGNDVESSS